MVPKSKWVSSIPSANIETAPVVTLNSLALKLDMPFTVVDASMPASSLEWPVPDTARPVDAATVTFVRAESKSTPSTVAAAPESVILPLESVMPVEVTAPAEVTLKASVLPMLKAAVGAVVPMPTFPAVVTSASPEAGLKVNVPVIVSLPTLT